MKFLLWARYAFLGLLLALVAAFVYRHARDR